MPFSDEGHYTKIKINERSNALLCKALHKIINADADRHYRLFRQGYYCAHLFFDTAGDIIITGCQPA